MKYNACQGFILICLGAVQSDLEGSKALKIPAKLTEKDKLKKAENKNHPLYNFELVVSFFTGLAGVVYKLSAGVADIFCFC